MQGDKRVYPAGGFPGKWLSYLMLFLSAVVLLSGLVSGGGEAGVEIAVAPTATPIPLDEGFDETPESRELVLPQHTWYALQLGAFEGERSAQELAQRFRLRGAAGYVWQDERYRALAALYPSRDDAQSVREQLMERHTVETWLFQVDLPAVRLRLSGMKGQLDILEAAFLHANDLVSQLQTLSVAMDRQERSADEALQALASLREQMETVRLRLEQRFSSPRHQTVEGLICCFADYAAFSGELAGGESAVELAARVKHQTLQSLRMLKSVYDELGDT